MTIRVNIKNEDPRETAVIAIKGIDPTTGQSFAHGTNVELKGGESRDFYIHDTAGLAVTEVSQ